MLSVGLLRCAKHFSRARPFLLITSLAFSFKRALSSTHPFFCKASLTSFPARNVQHVVDVEDVDDLLSHENVGGDIDNEDDVDGDVAVADLRDDLVDSDVDNVV